MDAITFQTEVDGEQVIRPPADVVLPPGTWEVPLRPVSSPIAPSTAARDTANARLRQHRVSLGHATGIDNESIDADLARLYGDK
jgi:hypothetical protein